MIFSAPKVQLIQVFKQLNLSSKTDDDDFLETLEIILLGCISSRWNHNSQHLMLASYDMPTISKQYQQMCDLLQGRSQSLHVEVETVNPKEKEIVEYIGELLAGQVNQLCKLSPALVAAAIPTWSPLFRLYLAEIKTQFKGEYSTIRHCSCANDIKEHIDCEIISGALAERIWCLYIFHVCESNRRHEEEDGETEDVGVGAAAVTGFMGAVGGENKGGGMAEFEGELGLWESGGEREI
ncbi:hypothetical protein Nepgr_032744 [Nepenthes gracilis]|uniref:Uncharacterized protein n=1 Tax=Nepenthes gracilis TaxID=150966 RepID=A0AAD3Y8J0_NEPGR|nr:hypothetical protein Nepgr_032744 [Nepenthes gracilis]